MQHEQHRIRMLQIQEEEDKRKQEEGKRRRLEEQTVETLENKLKEFKREVKYHNSLILDFLFLLLF